MIKQFDWKFSTNKELFADLKVTELPDNKKPMTKMFRYDLEFNEDTHWKLVQLSALKKMHQEDFVEELLTCVMEVLLMNEEEKEEKNTQVNHSGDSNKIVPPPVATDEELIETWHNPPRGIPFVGRAREIYDLGVAHGQASSQEVAELMAELERERIRLAACGVVAKADTPESAKKARDMHPDYHSASLDDVISMVDALIAERANQAHSWKMAEPAPVAGGLVDRVTRAVTLGSNPDICVNIWSDIAACTAIIEVAKWLEECDLACARGAARLLNQEAQ
jgi:hypothetical protein